MANTVSVSESIKRIASRLHEIATDLRRPILDPGKVRFGAIYAAVPNVSALRLAITMYGNADLANSIISDIESLRRRYEALFVFDGCICQATRLQQELDAEIIALRDIAPDEWPENCRTNQVSSLVVDLHAFCRDLPTLVQLMHGKREQELETIGEAWKGSADGKPPKASANAIDRWKFAKPLREKRIGWKLIHKMYVEDTGDPVDAKAFEIDCGRARKAEESARK